MVVQLTLNINVDTDETREVITDRLGIFDYDSLSGCFDDVMDEFGEITSIDLENIN